MLEKSIFEEDAEEEDEGDGDSTAVLMAVICMVSVADMVNTNENKKETAAWERETQFIGHILINVTQLDTRVICCNIQEMK